MCMHVCVPHCACEPSCVCVRKMHGVCQDVSPACVCLQYACVFLHVFPYMCVFYQHVGVDTDKFQSIECDIPGCVMIMCHFD